MRPTLDDVVVHQGLEGTGGIAAGVHCPCIERIVGRRQNGHSVDVPQNADQAGLLHNLLVQSEPKRVQAL